MLKFYTKLALAAVGLFAFSCTLQDHVIPTTPDVYVSGYEHTDANKTAKYWKNGNVVDLLSSNDGITATSIAASGGDVYVVGWDGDSSFTAQGKYWKNGASQQFSGAYSPAFLSKVLLSGNDLYIAGTGVDAAGYYALYWKNGVPVTLNNSQNGWARDMAIVGGDVYVAGNASGEPGELAVAKYWKNGVDVKLTSGPEQQYPNGIAVSGSDVHVVGTSNGLYRTIAKYWKNGVETILDTLAYHSSAQDVAILGSDVFIVGSRSDSLGYSNAIIWKNGVESTLPGGATATGITIVGNDIYVSGSGLNGVTGIAKYWKNGVPMDLTNGVSNTAATSIFVVTP